MICYSLSHYTLLFLTIFFLISSLTWSLPNIILPSSYRYCLGGRPIYFMNFMHSTIRIIIHASQFTIKYMILTYLNVLYHRSHPSARMSELSNSILTPNETNFLYNTLKHTTIFHHTHTNTKHNYLLAAISI